MMQLPQLLEGLVDVPVPDVTISAVATDSREVVKDSLFIALAGFGGPHGLEFAEQALNAGAVAVLWEPADNAPNIGPLACDVVLSIAELQALVGVIAARFYDNPSEKMSVVGVTGTDGKTSCAWLLLQAWAALDKPAAMIGTLGKGSKNALRRGAFTTPFAVELQSDLADFASADIECVAMEVSSHALDQGRVTATQFDAAVLTNLARDHLDYHGTVGAYASAKAKLFTDYGAKNWVLNTDDAFGRGLAERASGDVQIYSYGIEAETLKASNLRRMPNLCFDVEYQGECYAIETCLLGDFNVHNVLAVMAVLLSQGVEMVALTEVVKNIQAPPGRLELFATDSAKVVVDYAHTPGALEASLASLKAVSVGRVMCVFGCGGDRDTGKRALMAKAAEAGADLVWVTDDNPRSEAPSAIFDDIRGGFDNAGAVEFVHDRAEAIAAAVAVLRADDILLVAGKGHEDYQLLGNERRHFSDREVVAGLLGLDKPEALYA